MKVNWTGVYPALTTKFTPKGGLNLALWSKNVNAQLQAGAEGLIIGGSLGEASTLANDEKMRLLETTLELAAGKVPVLVNIAEGSTVEAVALAKESQQRGANGFMLLPPMRYKSTDDETLAFFLSVADATELPIMIYNNPVDYKIEVTLDMFEVLLQHPNIQAVKESTRDVSNVTRIFNRFGERLKVLTGVDTLAMESLVMGAHGWVAGLVCAFPKETVAIYRLVKAGRIAEALAIYRWFLPLLELDISPQLVQNIKLAEKMTGLGSEFVRPPRQPLKGAERKRVLQIIEKGLASRPALPKDLGVR